MEKKKEAKKQSIKYFDFVIAGVLAAAITISAAAGLFAKLDYRFYDFLLAIKRSPEQDKRILHVNIDNESIAEIGEWPWSRDIIADAMIRMRELGAERAVFDIEYLSKSPRGVPSDAEHNIDRIIFAEEHVSFV